jgi:hypothetical protein
VANRNPGKRINNDSHEWDESNKKCLPSQENRTERMKIFAMCMECQKELGIPSFEPIITDFYEEAYTVIVCSRGHKSALLLQSQKFEILLESAANALLEGYTLEAATSLSSAYERFFEFAINVFCKKSNSPKLSFEKTFEQVSKQSERQLGAFLFLHLIILGSNYQLSKKIPTLRNKVIHQGYIPTPNEVLRFGELIYQEISSLTNLLNAHLSDEVQQVVTNTLQERSEKIPKDMPRATTTGTMFFSLASINRKGTFQEALSSYAECREKLFGVIPYMRFLSKAVLLYTKLRKST